MPRPDGSRIDHSSPYGAKIRKEMFTKVALMAALSVDTVEALREGIQGELTPREIESVRTRIQRSAYPLNEGVRYSGKLHTIRENIAALRSSGILRTRLEAQKDAIILDALTRE